MPGVALLQLRIGSLMLNLLLPLLPAAHLLRPELRPWLLPIQQRVLFDLPIGELHHHLQLYLQRLHIPLRHLHQRQQLPLLPFGVLSLRRPVLGLLFFSIFVRQCHQQGM